jgi:hypothetical protein
MVWLLAAEHGTEPPRATDDIDLVVDVRARPAGVRHICAWLEPQSAPRESATGTSGHATAALEK